MGKSGEMGENLGSLDAEALADKLVLDLINNALLSKGLNVESPVDKFAVDLINNLLSFAEPNLKESSIGKYLLNHSREMQRDVALVFVDQIRKLQNPNDTADADKQQDWRVRRWSLNVLLRRNLPFTDDNMVLLFSWLNSEDKTILYYHLPYERLTATLERFVKTHDPSVKLRGIAAQVGDRLLDVEDNDCIKFGRRIVSAVEGIPSITLIKGDVWVEKVIADTQSMPSKEAAAWSQLLNHCQLASGGKPSAKWEKTARSLIGKKSGLAFEKLFEVLLGWFPLFDKPAPSEIRESNNPYVWFGLDALSPIDPNVDALKGLVWCCSFQDNPEVVRSLSTLCISAFKKISGTGPRAVRLGNACIYTLGALEGHDALAQLALLKVKIRNRGTQNQIAKALKIAADREGVTTDELEEMSVPDYGLTEIGILEESMGDITARLSITGSNSTQLEWVKADGKIQKSVPAAVKSDYAEELKELRSTAKDIQKMLPAIRERIDSFYLQQRSWPFTVWSERYLNHPLVAYIARRLIWQFEKKGETFTAIFHDGKFIDHHGKEIRALSCKAQDFSVRLWHPLDCDTTEVLAWRDWIEEQMIQQPFKQAHREIYLLTAAEENTNTYSNRYAAHIIKQHQFNALCQARGWRNSLRLLVDDEYPPASKSLEQWGIRAEFWIEGIGDDYGTDTTESGSYLYLATDQVRFYPIDTALSTAHAGGGGYGPGWRGEVGNPMPLADVPKLAFSEIMRDVDLFIGVSSVGNDPAWADGGPNGHHRDYWHSYSFGELSGTAKTRKEILERLLPRLKIANQSHIDRKFLVVEGSKHAYKIHLGSGNILMSPNDQYLCIVPNASQRKGGDKLFLPFEGDKVLAIILSKAFMLAEDEKIKDTTILAQIGK